MLSKQLYRQEYPTGKKPEKSQITLVLAVNLFTIYLGLEIFPGTHREYYRLHQLH